MKPLLSLCALGNAANRDGYVGQFAKENVPWFGYLFASGAVYTWPNAVAAQDGAYSMHGTTMTDTYQKDCCTYCQGH